MNIIGIRTALLYGHTAQPTFESDRATTGSTADPWLSIDKFQHMGMSFFITLGNQYSFESKFEMGEREATFLSATSTLALGVAKELYDRNLGPSGYFSYRDLVADAVGIGLAVAFISF